VQDQRGAIGLALVQVQVQVQVQDELAQLPGGSRQRINVELKWMEREGIVGIHQRCIVVPDQLEALAQHG
jgi:CRP/FNR family cyclic AMP-dependent transcriptional regulator